VRVETAGLLSPTSLYKGMVSSGIHSQVATELYSHEKAHADADSERRGEFGFYVTGGWIVAYYLIKGERGPEQLMKIASAPGFSRMSQQDWKIYNTAWSDFLNQVKEKKIRNEENEDNQNNEEMGYDGLRNGNSRLHRSNHSSPKYGNLEYSELRDKLIDLLAAKLDGLAEKGQFPKLEDLLECEFTDMVFKYGSWIYRAYNEAITDIRNSHYSQER
jgi:hypothetical protein